MHAREATFRDGQCRRPLVSKDVKTDGTICIDVGVVNLGGKADFGWFEWIVRGETD